MVKLDEINFGLLTEHEIFFLEQKVKREVERRKQQPEEYIQVVRADDGSEGFYVKVEDFAKVNSDDLHIYIAQTLEQGSQINFSLEQIEKEQAEDVLKRYGWVFDEESTDEDQTES